MKKSLLIVFVLLFLKNASAQDTEPVAPVKKYEYSYVTDRLFYTDEDIAGYTFIPNEYQHNNEEKEKLKPGDVKIHFTPSVVYFNGVKSLKNFNIISINTTKDGYKIDLMDVTNPSLSAVLELFKDEKHMIYGISFYSKLIGAYNFFIPEKSEKQLEKEMTYFTQQREYRVRNYEDMQGTKIYPYMQVPNLYQNFEYEKINSQDSISIEFLADRVVLTKGTGVQAYEFKKMNVLNYQGDLRESRVTRIIEIVWAMDKKFKINIYLSADNYVDKIEIGNAQYFLMM